MDSQFNPDTFIDLEVTGALDTQLIPVPVGEWNATLAEVKKVRPSTGKDGTQYFWLDMTWKITDQDVARHCERSEPTVRQSISLDITPQGGLDMGKGKNVDLGRLRDAFSLNDPASPFAIRMLQGRGAKVKVIHKADKDDSTKIYANITQVSKL